MMGTIQQQVLSTSSYYNKESYLYPPRARVSPSITQMSANMYLARTVV